MLASCYQHAVVAMFEQPPSDDAPYRTSSEHDESHTQSLAHQLRVPRSEGEVRFLARLPIAARARPGRVASRSLTARSLPVHCGRLPVVSRSSPAPLSLAFRAAPVRWITYPSSGEGESAEVGYVAV